MSNMFDLTRTPMSTGVNINFPSNKRQRNEISIDLVDDSAVSTPSFGENSAMDGAKGSKVSKRSNVLMQYQVDELKTLTEQQKRLLDDLKSEHVQFKESAAKQMEFLEDQNQKLRKDFEAQKQKNHDDKKKYNSKIQQLENEKELLSQQVKSKTAALKPTIQSVEQLNSAHEKQLSQQIATLQHALTEKQEDLRKQMTKSLELERANFTLEKEAFVLKQQQRLLPDDLQDLQQYKQKYSVLESQYRQQTHTLNDIQGQLKNQLLLEEQLSSLQSQYKLQSNQLIKFQSREADFFRMKDELELWTELLQDLMTNVKAEPMNAPAAPSNRIISNITPTQVRQMISSLQEKYIIQQRQYSDLQQQYLTCQHQLAATQSTAQENQIISQQQKSKFVELEHQLQHLQQQISSTYQPEIQSLRELLKTFDQEAALKCNQLPNASKKNAMNVADYQHSKDELISSLQKQLDVLREENSKLIKEKSDNKSSSTTATAMVVDDNAEDGELPNTEDSSRNFKEEYDTMLAKYAEVQEDYQALQEYSGLDYLPHKTQVLRLKHNPSHTSASSSASTIPKEIMKQLRVENKELKDKLKASIDASNSAANDQKVSLDENNHSSVGNSNMDPNKLNQRLKEMFKEKIATFRESVYLLTGYKVEMTTQDSGMPLLRLRSMYAESPEDDILFQLNGGTPELLETDFVITLDEKFMEYLSKYNSIPAFLANITLHLFESQTFLG